MSKDKSGQLLDRDQSADDCSKSTNHKEKFISCLEQIVDSQLSDCDFGVNQLSTLIYLDRTQLYRKMMDYLGVSPYKYIKQKRMKVAAGLMIHSDKNISDIAALCGYRNHSAFSKAFQSIYGCTPVEYRVMNN